MHPRDLSIADFTYDLPPERIAQHPLADRDASRLLVYREGVIKDRVFRELPELLPANALLVLNDTRVVNARLHFRKESGATVEVFCLEPAGGGPVEAAFAQRGEVLWQCALGNAKRWKAGPLGHQFRSPQGDAQLFAERLSTGREGTLVRLTWEPAELTFSEVLARAGEVPLPPYMHRAAEAEDSQRYQTVYARHEGSVAAPTAGLHFTPALMDALKAKGMEVARVTLHVGAGTFRPVKSRTLSGHAMHQERIEVTRAAVQTLHEAVGQRPIVVVGTTSLRTLESLYWHGVMLLHGEASEGVAIDQWYPYENGLPAMPDAAAALKAVLDDMDVRGEDALSGHTSLLIAPGYAVKLADALITNFHQPQSTLLLLVEAFAGPARQRIYRHALDHGYRFLSYGDGSLLWRAG
ncbi:MAG: S-adenosylmethionine:tRNA ribosyltransferase-isomerase [Flavobacteriales bacterium]|nr:S-adenosylmethionine:tRNA ribosyltransferase-isomerase [Flavobacteriales bacterium]